MKMRLTEGIEEDDGRRNEMTEEEGVEDPSTSRTMRPARNGRNRERGVKGRFVSIVPEADRFWAKVDRSDQDGCWLWTGRVTAEGYGRFDLTTAARGEQRAHRWSWEQVNGPVPEGLTLDHLIGPGEPCTSPRCVRPDHLEPVTNAVNLSRRHARDRRAADPAAAQEPR